MERDYYIGQHVIYVDPQGVSHDALVTAWWAQGYDHRKSANATADAERHKELHGHEPGCNLVLVSGDEAQFDPYGRQIARETSVAHKVPTAMPGRYWKWPDE